MTHHPLIAIISSNTLAGLGLKNILQTVMPIMTIDIIGSFYELQERDSEKYVHYFVSEDIALDNLDFFSKHNRKTIVLTLSGKGQHLDKALCGFHCICISEPEQNLVKSLLFLEQMAHAHGRNIPPVPSEIKDKPLSDREIEVLSLIVQGFINKEIANKLNIALATVITHRKNIMDKLNVKSVSALTIYAVTHGYVDINLI